MNSVRLLLIEAEADETWSFLKTKANNQWVWLALDVDFRQVIAFYDGDRSRKSAGKLWNCISQEYRVQATFHKEDREAYKKVIPAAQYRVCAKGTGLTNAIERFNCTIRQRVARLVRTTLSF
jgi:insertion element IS1 protein InsB